jgi:hypothetical protein
MIHNLYLIRNNVKTPVCITGEDKDSVIEDLMNAMNDRHPARCFNKSWSNVKAPLLVVNMSRIDLIEYVSCSTDPAYPEPIDEILIIAENNPTIEWSMPK